MREVHFFEIARYEDFCITLDFDKITENNPPHTHDFHELEIVLAGSAINSINGISFPVGPGDVFVVEKGATHEITQIDGLELYNLGFRSDAMHLIGSDLLELPGFHTLFLMGGLTDPSMRRMKLSAQDLQRCTELLQEMDAELLAQVPGYRTSVLCQFSRLIVLLSRANTRTASEQSIWQVATAAAKMERDYAEPISIAELAKSVLMSERHFRRQFLQLYQTTPSDYLLQLRLSAACRMLRSKEDSITQVAMANGFSDCNYFSRIFRREFGITPSQYRAQHED